MLWRRLSCGSVAEFFVLDCRGERGGSLYLSEAQLGWLQEALEESSARFKFILNSVPISDVSRLYGPIQAEDRWEGYPEQRAGLLSFVRERGIQGVVWLAGDFHFGMAGLVDPPGEGDGDTQWEVLVGPAGSFINPAVWIYRPDDQFALFVREWNHVRFEADPVTGVLDVSFVADDGTVIEQTVLEL